MDNKTLFRRVVAVAVVVVAVSCQSGGKGTGRSLSESLAVAPPRGSTCYRGTARFFTDTTGSPTDPHGRPWLVLDPALAPESGYRVAHLVTPENRKTPVYARWRRVGDSIEVQELNALPPASWVFADSGAFLVGRGNMVHDVVVRDLSGRLVPTESNWRARAQRVSCADIS